MRANQETHAPNDTSIWEQVHTQQTAKEEYTQNTQHTLTKWPNLCACVVWNNATAPLSSQQPLRFGISVSVSGNISASETTRTWRRPHIIKWDYRQPRSDTFEDVRGWCLANNDCRRCNRTVRFEMHTISYDLEKWVIAVLASLLRVYIIEHGDAFYAALFMFTLGMMMSVRNAPSTACMCFWLYYATSCRYAVGILFITTSSKHLYTYWNTSVSVHLLSVHSFRVAARYNMYYIFLMVVLYYISNGCFYALYWSLGYCRPALFTALFISSNITS